MKPVVSGTLFSISVAFVFKANFATKLVISGILILISVAFVFKAAFITRSVISGILFFNSATLALRAAVVANPLILGIFCFQYLLFFANSCYDITFKQVLRCSLLQIYLGSFGSLNFCVLVLLFVKDLQKLFLNTDCLQCLSGMKLSPVIKGCLIMLIFKHLKQNITQ